MNLTLREMTMIGFDEDDDVVFVLWEPTGLVQASKGYNVVGMVNLVQRWTGANLVNINVVIFCIVRISNFLFNFITFLLPYPETFHSYFGFGFRWVGWDWQIRPSAAEVGRQMGSSLSSFASLLLERERCKKILLFMVFWWKTDAKLVLFPPSLHFKFHISWFHLFYYEGKVAKKTIFTPYHTISGGGRYLKVTHKPGCRCHPSDQALLKIELKIFWYIKYLKIFQDILDIWRYLKVTYKPSCRWLAGDQSPLKRFPLLAHLTFYPFPPPNPPPCQQKCSLCHFNYVGQQVISEYKELPIRQICHDCW